jgi:uncharacterized membrane protein
MITTNDPLESYIARFQAQLPRMTLAQRQDIVDEIRAHVHDRVASSGVRIPEVLDKLGPAEDLAKEYHRGALVSDRGFTSWKMLRSAGAWLISVIHCVAIGMTAAAGYAGALVCFAVVLARALFPVQTALWITPDFEMSMGVDHPFDAQPFLENWLQPLAFGFGVLVLLLTTMTLRRLLPWCKRWISRATQPVGWPDLRRTRSAALHLSHEFVEAQTRLAHRLRARLQSG